MNTKATPGGMTYAGSGVDYSMLDPFKRECQLAARETAHLLKRYFNFEEVDWSRGESAYAMRLINGEILAHVQEGLGTKNLVADIMYAMNPARSYYDNVAQDTVAMIVNDMITIGVLPVSVAMHLSVSSATWFEDAKRRGDLIAGWKLACELSGAVWAGGETPALKGVIVEGTSELSGSATGYASDEADLLHPDLIEDGDAIIFLESNGIHANGLTLARKVAELLPEKYMTLLRNGRTYGETLLDPTPIYVPFMRDCLEHGVDIRYAVNVTGHGWRKLMRGPQFFEYIIEKLPIQHEVFDIIQRHGNVSAEEMYGNYNMGAGFAVYVPEASVDDAIDNAKKNGFTAFKAGFIRASDKKRVVIVPEEITFEADELAIR